MVSLRGRVIYFILFWLFITVFVSLDITHASRIDELKSQISSQINEIDKVEEEIDKYKEEINKTQQETNSLKNQVKILDTNSKKLGSDISLTQNKIKASNLNIEKLSIQIKEKSDDISSKKASLAEILRSINESDNVTLVEIFLTGDSLSDFFGDVSRLNGFQTSLNASLVQLEGLKEELGGRKTEEETEKKNTENLKDDLLDQRKLVDINKKNKNTLLKETQNKESNYKKILEEKIRLKEEFEKELREFEAQLKIEIDPTSIPPAGSGILSWPLDKVYITQRFGKTVASKKLYVSGSHNGVDFRASVGTRALAAGNGVVVGVGDTDQTCPRASFGKWVLIDYENGLASTYAHLSLTKVSTGQRVNRGDVIGYTGNTGYSTGPHLHLSVYASQGVSVQSRASKSCKGSVYTMPLAPIEAYLDPLDYL